MINLYDLGQVYIVCGRTNMRRSIDGLAAIVKDKFDLDPFSEKVFIFCGGSCDRFKALYWNKQIYDQSGRYLLFGSSLVLSNNHAERAIKTLVIGRKNWLFSQSFKGAQTSAIILSLIETAKRNNLDPEKYIEYLLDKLPNEETLTDKKALSAYLPWTKEVQAVCKIKEKQRKAA